MTRLIAVLLGLTLATSTNWAFAQSRVLNDAQQQIEQGVDDITSGIGDMVQSFDPDKLSQTPSRDLLTLGIGGAAGYMVGSIVSGIGIFSIDLIGISVIPVAGALAGIYLANEGYFDDIREMLP